MKKLLLTSLLAAAAIVTAQAQSISLTNTFGGNSDNVGTSDFLKFNKDGTKKEAVVGDRIQLDLGSQYIDSRVRINLSGDAAWAPKVQGYASFKPFKGFNLIGGNSFFAKWATPGAYLSATDDYLSHGKLTDNNGAGVVYNFSNDDIGFAVSGTVGAVARLDLNFGAQFTLNDTFTVGFTAQDVTEKTFTLGGYASLLAVENLLLNLGYTYNTNDETYFSATEHLLQVSGGYKIKDANLALYADAALGLNNRKYDATAGDFVTLSDGIPFYLAFRASYALNENLNLNGWVRVNHSLTATENHTVTTVYPYFDYKTKFGTFRSGVRFTFNDTDGYAGFNIPFSWQYKIANN